MKYYTGVGSRETPPDVMVLIRRLAYELAHRGWAVRSGCADGADSAFEQGWWAYQCTGVVRPCGGAELYLPWKGFSKVDVGTYPEGVCMIPSGPLEQRARQRAAAIHPAWDRLKEGAKKLHSRNVFQVLGQDLNTPSKFLVCWATTDKHGVPKGGTRTAWVLAKEEGVECFNLYNEDDRRRIESWLQV